METKTVPLRSVDQTVAEMLRIIDRYSSDVGMYASWTPERFYKLVRAIPYKADPRGNEWLQRPAATLAGTSQFSDCDDLAILMCAYAKQAGIAYRLAIGGSSAYKNQVTGKVSVPFHHVWPELRIGGKWVPMDGTYTHYVPYTHNQNYLKIRYYYPKTT